MSKKNFYRFAILLTIVVGAYLNNKWHNMPITPEKKAPVYTMSLRDTSTNVEIKSTDNFWFKESDYNIVEPVSDSIKKAIIELKKYLEKDTLKNINVIGLYATNENNNSALPNLGIARAISVKKYMVSQGLLVKRINVLGEASYNLKRKDGYIDGPLSFNITLEDKSKEYKELKQKIISDPLIVYFESGESQINLDKEQRQKVIDIITYLDKVDGEQCLIIGHTDNNGNGQWNIKLGLERAKIIKDYLIKNGLAEDKVRVASKGSEDPITSNATEEGKAKNRRTEITFNQN